MFEIHIPVFLIIGRRDRLNFSNIFNTNKRQFTSVLKREGITVTNYYDSNKTYRVFFRRNGKGTNPQGKLRFYYAQDTDITIGTIFTLKGENYLVISQDGIESDVYYTSIAVRCDTTFSVWISAENRYVNVPCAVISDKYTLTHNSTITMISGSVTVYTGLNSYSEQMEMNNAYYNFGGYYKVGNTFYNNGLAYVYMTREAMPSTDTYSLTYNGSTSVDLSDGVYQLSYTATKNGFVVNNPYLSYTVSDNTIATVSETGLLTMLAAGNVTVTTTWTDAKNTTCTTTITIADTSDPDVPTGTTTISGNTNMKYAYTRTYTATFYDGSNNAVDGGTAVWGITNCAFESNIKREILEGNKVKLSLVDKNEIYIGQSFTLNATDTDGNFTTASITVNIIE